MDVLYKSGDWKEPKDTSCWLWEGNWTQVGTFWIWYGNFVFESGFSLAYFLCKVMDSLSFFVHPKRLLRAMACVWGANNEVMQFKVNRCVKKKRVDSWFEPVYSLHYKIPRGKPNKPGDRLKLYFLLADSVEYIVGKMNKLLISITCQIEFKSNNVKK